MQSDLEQKLLVDLESLFVDNDDLTMLEERVGRFCIFEALKIVKAEVPLGNLLAALLDPNQPHGFGSDILRIFLLESTRAGREVGVATSALAPLATHLLDLDDVEVRREWQRIDILIVLKAAKTVIAVELKVGSAQSVNQLKGYRETVEEAFSGLFWERIFVFLTVNPEEPNDKAWIPLRYETLVPALSKVNRSGADKPAAIMLTSFLDMLRRHYVTDEEMEEIARKLWVKHKAALTFLADRRPDGVRAVFTGLADQITAQFATSPFSFQADKGGVSIYRYGCCAWDSYTGIKGDSTWTPSGRMLLFELKRESDQINAYLNLGPGSPASRGKLVEVLASFRHRQDLPPGNDWMCLGKKNLFIYKPNEDLDLNVARQAIVSGFTKFCQETATKLTPALSALKRTTTSPTATNTHPQPLASHC